MNIDISEEFEMGVKGLPEHAKIGIIWTHFLQQLPLIEAHANINSTLIEVICAKARDRRNALDILEMFYHGAEKAIKNKYNQQTGNRIILPGDKH